MPARTPHQIIQFHPVAILSQIIPVALLAPLLFAAGQLGNVGTNAGSFFLCPVSCHLLSYQVMHTHFVFFNRLEFASALARR